MRKLTILLPVLFLFLSGANAQKVYFTGKISYDAGILKTQSNIRSTDLTVNVDTNYTYTAIQNSFASGMRFNLGIGIMITKYLSFELNGFYNTCREQKMETTDHFRDAQGYDFFFPSQYTMKGRFFGVKPLLVLMLPGEDFRPFAKVGAILASGGLEEKMQMNASSNHPSYVPFGGMSSTLEFKKRFTVGLNAAIGVEYMFLKRMWVTAEVEANIARYAPESAEYTSYIVSGKDMLGQMTTAERKMEFVDSYSDADNAWNKPTKMLSVRYSFCSVGFTVGIKYTLFD